MTLSYQESGCLQMITKRFLVALVILVAFWGCQLVQNKAVPDDLVGVWETSALKYKNRIMEFKKEIVIFGTGDGNRSIHPIRKVKTVHQGKKSLYTVYYLGQGGGEYSFSFFYDPGDDVITFKNQMTIQWKKSLDTRGTL